MNYPNPRDFYSLAEYQEALRLYAYEVEQKRVQEVDKKIVDIPTKDGQDESHE